ncbi:MAG: hypothetical protein O9303_01405 [Silanimonas sp.]|nr:hypothetical protein [Silanimonas sp.]
MTITARLLDRWKEAKGITSDRQAALALGVSHALPAHWRNGKNAHAAIIEGMARDLGHNDREIAAMLFESMAESAHADADSRKTFERLAKKVRTLALTAVAVLASSSFPAPSHARAHGYEEAGAVFIMRTFYRRPRWANLFTRRAARSPRLAHIDTSRAARNSLGGRPISRLNARAKADALS